jgi:MFS family permease
MTASAHRSAPAASDGQGSRAYRALVLGVLTLVYVFNFIDRVILGVLAPQIQTEMRLSDVEVGLMLGPPFAIFYSFLGLPIAWLADRFSRTWIMTAALTLWSGCTALCGRVATFPQLMAARVGVGVGEAGGVAPAYSVIADYFPQGSRARALAIYAFAIPVGSALAAACGGLFAKAFGWRGAFLAVGLAGLPLAPLLRLVVRDPKRAKPADGSGPGLLATLRILAGKPAFWLMSFGAGSSSMVGYGLIAWLPSFLMRSFHLSVVERGWYYAGILFFGGLIGVWAGGWLGDRLGKTSRAAYVLVPAAAFLLAVPGYAAAVQAPSRTVAFFLFLLPQALSLAWLGPVTAAIQHMAPQPMRSTASSLFLLINNFVGLALGPVFYGAVSQALKPRFGAESLHYAVLAGLGFYVLAALLLAAAAGRIRRDWID